MTTLPAMKLPKKKIKQEDKTNTFLGSTSGFTLIELGLVVLLISLMFGLVIPKIETVLGLDEGKKVRLLRALIEKAYIDAHASKVPFFIHIDMDNREAWVDTASDTLRHHQPLGQYDPIRFSHGTFIRDVWLEGLGIRQGGEIVLPFSKKSLPERFMIHIEGKSGYIYTIWLNPLTGATYLETEDKSYKMFSQYEDKPFYPGI